MRLIFIKLSLILWTIRKELQNLTNHNSMKNIKMMLNVDINVGSNFKL